MSSFHRVLYGIGNSHHCGLCGFTGWRFKPYGRPPKRRADVHCPACGSVERHRLAQRLLEGVLEPGQRTLHVAPEPSIAPWLGRISSDYLSIDLHNEAMVAMDLMALELPDGDRTLVWCSHVLEHVEDDRRALAEVFRVLAPGGRAVLQVPIRGETTLEDPTITSPEARTEAYLQWDHVRLYGRDFAARVREAGFEVEIRSIADVPAETVARERLAFYLTNDVFVCTRPAA